jgi:hypothetical protein
MEYLNVFHITYHAAKKIGIWVMEATVILMPQAR